MKIRYRHAQLLLALSLLLFARPFLATFVGAAIVELFMFVTFVSAIVACATRRLHLVIGIGLTILIQAAGIYRRITGTGTLDLAYEALALVFFGFAITLLLTDVFRDSRRVSADTICGALAAYLLLGVFWAFGYAFLEGVMPNSFHGLPAAAPLLGNYERFIGYSFVTLTTLGYGNVVPATPRAEAFAVAEAIVGQVYLTVLVARLVALNLLAKRDDDDPSPE